MRNKFRAAILVASVAASAFGQSHPFLFLDSNDVARIQANAVFDSEFEDLAQAQINIANNINPASLPPFETDWWAEEEAKGYRGADRAVTFEHLRLVPLEYSVAALDCARAWILTDNVAYLDKAKTILLMQSEYDFGFGDANGGDVNDGLDYTVSTIRTLEAYDIAYDRFTPAEHDQMEDFFMRLLAAVVRCDDYWVGYTNGEINNHEGWHQASMAMVGFFYDLQTYIDRAISDYKGFYDMLDGFLDEGLWQEASLPYQYVQLEAMLFTAERARYAGYPVDLLTYANPAGRSLQSCFDTVFDLTFPDGLLPAVGDGYGGEFYPGGYKEYEQLYTRLGDSKYAWLIDRSGARDRESLHRGFADVSGGSAPAATSRLWPEHGYAALRSNEGTSYWNGEGWSLFSCFHSTYPAHAHPDKLSIMLYADDHLWLRDSEGKADRPEKFTAPITEAINRETLAHNTVVIDLGNQNLSLHAPLDLLEYSVPPGEKRLTVGDALSQLYPGIRQLRTCIVRDDYVVDVFQVKADQTHEISWTTHINGDVYNCFDSVFSPANFPTNGPWEFIMADDVSAPTNRFWEIFDHGGNYFRMDVATDHSARYTRFRFPLLESDPVGSSIPMRMVGGEGSNAVFVAVYRKGDSPIADPVGINIGSAADGEDWVLGITHQGTTEEFTIRGLVAPPVPPAPAPFVDDANTELLLHMDTATLPDDDSANPGRDRDAYLSVPVPTLEAGMPGFGNAAVFNGVDSRIHVKNSGSASAMPTDNVRYEFWLKNAAKTGDNAWMTVFLDAWDIALEVQDRDDGKLRMDFDVYDSTGTKFDVIGTDLDWGFDATVWNHYAMEVENGTFSVYINHGLVGSASGLVGGMDSGSRNMDIGTHYNVGNHWEGSMDEFRISSLVSASPYEAWLGQYPGVGIHTNALADPDGDGLGNLHEWAFGGNPSYTGFIGHTPVFRADGANGFECVHAKRNDAAALGLTYFFEQSTNLVDGAWGATTPDTVETGVLDADFDSITNHFPVSGEDQGFIRLRIESD